MTTKPDEPLLTQDQIVELLQVAASYDRRTIGDADVVAWAHAAKHARWAVRIPGAAGLTASNHVAVDAIRHHYAHSTAYLMPGHITEYVRNWRRVVPPPVAEAIALLEPAPPACDETRQQVMDLVRELSEKTKLPKDVA